MYKHKFKKKSGFWKSSGRLTDWPWHCNILDTKFHFNRYCKSCCCKYTDKFKRKFQREKSLAGWWMSGIWHTLTQRHTITCPVAISNTNTNTRKYSLENITAGRYLDAILDTNTNTRKYSGENIVDRWNLDWQAGISHTLIQTDKNKFLKKISSNLVKDRWIGRLAYHTHSHKQIKTSSWRKSRRI